MPVLRLNVFLVLTLGLVGSTPTFAEVDYEQEVKPILRDHCYACHGAFNQESDLRLDTGAAMRIGGGSGPAVIGGDPDESLLIQVVTGEAGYRMPPEDQGSPLSEEDIDTLRRWIAEGANSPADEQPQADPATYWSYQPIERPGVPDVEDDGWGRTPIDAFIAARHEEQGLVPVGEASREAWLRRVTLDLTGLPPTRDELHAFLADDSEEAYERVVDDLLNRPEYGERWGRHWMDVWRYSDWYGSRGINQIRYSQRHIWRWRDWIVESLNADKGYDAMIREMIAGDELAPRDPDTYRATGFLGRNWYKFDRNVWMFDTVEQTAQAFLGVTMRCARCHDHKYDPLTQEEYYRFRAFFEPHDVRTDPVDAVQEMQKDTGEDVLVNGVARVYDKELEAATYVFRRGDGRHPIEDNPLTPGVPAALGGDDVNIETVALPPEAYYPALREELVAAALEFAQGKIGEADQRVIAARADFDAAQAKSAEFRAEFGEAEEVIPEPFLAENFDERRDDVWQVVNGDWVWEEGHLVEKQVGGFLTIVTKENHPRDFRAVVKYRTLQPGTYRSVGFSYDYVDQGNSQDVYTATSDSSQSIQAFHRTGGKQSYPQAGIVKTSLNVGDLTTVEVEVRGSLLTIDLNGERKLDYVLPIERREGRFALWVHQGSAEFHEVTITPLTVSLADLERAELQAQQAIEIEQHARTIAEAGLVALQARIAAEQAKYGVGETAGDPAELKMAASRAERQIAVREAEKSVLQAEHRLSLVELSGAAVDSEAASDAAAEPIEAALTEARAALEAARAAVESADGTYTPLGETFPATSTGRRTALANWIASPRNPRTARVAVNHIWLRHFGEALVPTVENFGLNGAAPSHPDLLNWLSAELIDNGWRMKSLHRMIVLSSVYRMQSSPAGAPSENERIDSGNRFLWRMNSRRMEAEVVRDSVLFLTGALDLTRGGPEIPEAEGQTSYRRSLYFRNTPNEKMPLLDLFDVADPNQCYRRKESVIPQQALALLNSGLALDRSRALAEELTASCGEPGEGDADVRFVAAAFETILTRSPTDSELATCAAFLESQTGLLEESEQTPFPPGGVSKRAPATDPRQRARENLLQVLFSHNDFVTIR